MIDLHYAATPNGEKVAIFLEETGLEYNLIPYELFKGEHLTPEFRRINPNHRLPAIVDHAPVGGGNPVSLAESGAILLYLGEKTGKFLSPGGGRRASALQWLFWQMSGLGPMHGQAHHFVRYAPVEQPYAIERYKKEAQRLVLVLEHRLREAEYLAEEYSIADMACWPWIQVTKLIGIELNEFPEVSRWSEAIANRPAVLRVVGSKALAVPAHYLQAHAKLTDEERSNVFGDRMHAAARLN
jgi:GSH-dependent disulfide-bond oxidoreductase